MRAAKDISTQLEKPFTSTLTFRTKYESELLKVVLLSILQNFLQETSINSHNFNQKESYQMDKQVMSALIHSILETGEYTLEGIANDTHIPFDIIYDAAYGNTRELSITPWSRIVALFFKVRPEIAQILLNKLLHRLERGKNIFSSLLNEK